jgi:hypothetical protein
MREALFILLVILVLLGWTAFRYRKTIAGIFGFAKMLKEAKDGAIGNIPSKRKAEKVASVLVNCSKCGVWVPQNRARKLGDQFFCSDECLRN